MQDLRFLSYAMISTEMLTSKYGRGMGDKYSENGVSFLDFLSRLMFNK